MKTEMISSQVCLPHPKYIRLKTIPDHVAHLYDVLRDAKEWPFPPVSLTPIPASEENLIKEGKRYYIIDGHNRTTAAQMVPCDVKAVVHSGLTEADAIALQVSENAKNGMALNFAARKRAVDALAGTGMKQRDICDKTGLPKWTVSRILSDKAGTVAGTEKDKRTAAGKKDGKKSPKKFDVEKWSARLGKVLADFDAHRKTITRPKSWNKEIGEHLDALSQLIAPEEDGEGEGNAE